MIKGDLGAGPMTNHHTRAIFNTSSSSMLFWASFSIALLVPAVLSVHPHPNATQEVKDYHRLRRQTYPTSYINSGLCTHVSYEECLQLEDEMRDNARLLKDVFVTHGFIRVLVLLVQFPDHRDRNLPTVAEYEELFNDHVRSQIIPTGSVSNWVEQNSYGAFKIEAEVMDWVVTDMTEEEYSFEESGISVKFRKAMYPALDHLEEQGFDFSRFDMNGDGIIDSIVVLHSGYAAEIGGIDCKSGADVTHRIWSHAIASMQKNWKSKKSGIRAGGYCVSSGLRGQCHTDIARISVITHEFMHTLGLPDLNDGSGEWIGRGTGDFDIMSNAHGRDGTQIYPAFLSPWSKMQLGWIEPIEIMNDGTFQIVASEVKDEVYVIREKFPSGEYLIIENRQPLMWDELLWNGGLLIWHFDDHQDLLRYRGYPGQSGWPGNGLHYAMAVLAADGNYDIEEGNNGGDDGDYWRAGAAPLGPGPLEAEASDVGIYPNTNTYQKGNIQQTGIVIDQVSDSAPQMSFRVTGFAPPPSTPVPTPEQTIDPMVLTTPEPTQNPTSTPTLKSIPITTQILIPIPMPTPIPTSAQTTSPEPTQKPTSTPTLKPIPKPTSIPTPIPTPILIPIPVPTPIPTSAQTTSPLLTVQPPLDLPFLLNFMPTTNKPSMISDSEATYPPAFLPWEDILPTASPSGVRISNIFLRAQPSQSIGKYMLDPVSSNARRMVITWYSVAPLILYASWVWV